MILTLILVLFVAISDARILKDSGRNATYLKGPIGVAECRDIDAPHPVNVIVPKCNHPPCILYKGETYEVEIDFEITDPRTTSELRVVVQGIIGGIELPWNGVNRNGCEDLLVGTCPMTQWDYFTYKTAIKVEAAYPTTKLIIKWQMLDDHDRPIWCFLLPAEIRPA